MRGDHQNESDNWKSLAALFQEYMAESGACIKLSCLNQNLMLQETVQTKQQFWTTSSQYSLPKTALHLLHLNPAPGKLSSGENLTAAVCKGASDLAQGIPVTLYRMVFIAVHRQMKH